MPFGEIIAFLLWESYENFALCERNVACLNTILGGSRNRYGALNGNIWKEISLVILVMKTNEMHYFANLFDKVLYVFRTYSLSIIRSIPTLYTQQ
jgi:hypothetical protein